MDDRTEIAAPVAPGTVEPVPAPAAQPAPAATGPKTFPLVDANAIREAFETGRYPYARQMATALYEKEKLRLQAELLKVQLWAQETGQKFVILFEGRDAAGKGGTIKRFMDPTSTAIRVSN